MYLYSSHLGGLYTSEDYLDWDARYCKQCGDSDQLIGKFNSVKEFWEIIKDECNIAGSGGYSLQYVYPFMIGELGIPDNAVYEDAHEKALGFCCNSVTDILRFIEETIKIDERRN